jgi:hypothetical protein
LSFEDPRIGMLDDAAWEAARPTICRTLGRTPNVADEINGLSERLDEAYRLVAGNLPDNASLRIEQMGVSDDLVLTDLDRLEEPASLIALRQAVSGRPLAASRFAGIAVGDRYQNRICWCIHRCERGGCPCRRT